jgi:ribonuclease R
MKERKNFHRNFHKKGRKNDKKISGIVSVNSRGIGYLEVPGFKEDIEIETDFLKTALNGDEVEIILLPKIKGQRTRGEVTAIKNRAKKQFVGVIEKNNNHYFLIPDDKKMYRDIFIPAEKANGIKDSQKVLVRITSWNDPKKNPEGEIVKIIGEKGDNNAEMQSIILEKGFEAEFSAEVLREADKIAQSEKANISEEIKNRKDFRQTTTFTIDPEDAKDFDDAISFKDLGEDKYEIGVHIADVSHYVKEKSALDKEARKRSFSIYLPDRTIPMLPEVLSNDLCSLNQGEDKFAFSAVFVINKNGKVLEKWFGKTTINSNKRFTYEEAQIILDNKNGNFYNELNTLNEIAKKFQAKKFHEGAIDFETEEVKFKLDENGKPIGVYKKQRLDTHKLVEEYMLLANKEVAEFIYKGQKKGAFVYRVHDVPDQEKIANLAVFLHAMGYNLNIENDKVSSKEINDLLKQIDGKDEESLIKTATLRAMAKAAYSTKNIGHFGLAFKYYTHFTSPIRRYPDLVVHRLLYRELTKGRIEQDEFAKYQKICIESSEQEKTVAEAERAGIKYKQVEYMKEHIGETFDAVISGITEWGIYAEEENTKCEGMIKLRDMKDDFYEIDKSGFSLIGTKTKKKYSLGDKIKIKVMAADLDKKTLDYALV